MSLLRAEVCQGAGHERRWECFPDRGNSRCRGLEVGGGMLRVSKEQVDESQCDWTG